MHIQKNITNNTDDLGGDITPEEMASLLSQDKDKNELKMRLVGLYGDLDEDTASETLFGMMTLKELGKRLLNTSLLIFLFQHGAAWLWICSQFMIQ